MNKTIWVLIFKTHAEQIECDFVAFWFDKPTVSELELFGFKPLEIETLLNGAMVETDCIYMLQEVAPNRGYVSSTTGLMKADRGDEK